MKLLLLCAYIICSPCHRHEPTVIDRTDYKAMWKVFFAGKLEGRKP